MQITTQFLILVPVILGVVQAIKIAGVASKWSALVAIALGAGFALALNGFEMNSLLQGIAAGLSAAGLYSGTKATLK
jgi:hypothetical protein